MATIGAPPAVTEHSSDDVWPLNVQTFDDFYREHYRSVLQTAVALTRDLAAAEDLTQDAFLATRQSWARIGSYDRPDLWVRRVVTNRSVSRFRRLMRETRALARLRDQHVRHIEVSEPGEEIWEAIASLPTRQAQVIVLVVLQDLHIDDVSALLGCGPETVRTHLRRGRATLAELLAQETP